TILKNEIKMGIRGSYTTAFAFDDLRIPASNLLGQEGQGFKIAMETLNGGRIGIASQALGIAEGAFERALGYSKERKQFGAPICDLQAIQFKLADMYSRIEMSKLLVYKAAWMKDSKMNYAMESAMCKMCASETATYVTKEAVQIHGGYGYIADYEVERMYRDAKITEIYEGTNEVQRVVISKMLLS
ncbi:MAG TPA: acyl-CoA dehydrogenase family protein, partial [Geobacteraceae bacterium]|nr:acyl-CoA dehydrogenase family protein [Geobacteraceae bacterium]